jgi:GTP-binding protein
MKITSAVFVKSAFSEEHWPSTSLPEVAFLGRSNVGKSSLINSLLGTRGLARTSNTPGRTQALNYFLINDRFHFVDLPGYGYARVPKAIRGSWSEMVTNFLANRTNLVLSIQIVDLRHEPTAQDKQLYEWLVHFGKPTVVVATKSDKLSQNELRRNLARTRQSLVGANVVVNSSVTGLGRPEIWKAIGEAVSFS